MIRHYFLAAILLIAGMAFGAGCSSQMKTKVESVNAENPNTSKNVEPASANQSAKQTRQVLWDFKKQIADEQPTFSAAETRAVLKYLFGDRQSPNLEITSRVSGSFTKPNAKETLYFISGCMDEETKLFTTDCPHVAWNTAGWIAIYDGQTPVLKIEEALGGDIEKVTDVNGDGINEILNSSGYGGMGITTLNANLGQISGNKYKSIQSFKGYVSNCDEGDISTGKHNEQAAVITYTPTTDGKMPAFSEEFFETQCSTEETKDKLEWKKITKKEFDDFFDAHS